MGEACSMHGIGEVNTWFLWGKPEGKKPLGRPKHRWDIRMEHQEVECGGGGLDWIDLAQDRDRWWALVNAVKNLRVP